MFGQKQKERALVGTPTPAGSARHILNLFGEFSVHPGEVLSSNNLTSYAAHNGLRSRDIVNGVDYGYEQGWFEAGPDKTIRLTHKGYEQV